MHVGDLAQCLVHKKFSITLAIIIIVINKLIIRQG